MITINSFKKPYIDHEHRDRLGNPIPRFDWWIRDHTTCEFKELSDVINSMCQPANLKTDVGMWNFAAHSSSPNYVLNHGKSMIKRNDTQSFIGTTVLILDYEHTNYTIDDFITEFDDYEFIVHHSYSTFSASKQGAECFRVLLRVTDDLIPTELLDDKGKRSIVPALLQTFQFVDPTTFQLKRAFYIPAIRPEIADRFRCEYHAGKPFDWTTLPVTVAPDRPMTPIAPLIDPTNGNRVISSLRIFDWFVDQDSSMTSTGSNEYSVTCPNGAAHSDGDDSARLYLYEGKYWAFKCFHGHCDPGNTNWARAKIYEQNPEAAAAYCRASEPDGALTLKKREGAAPEAESLDEPVEPEAREISEPASRVFINTKGWDVRSKRVRLFVETVTNSNPMRAEHFVLRTPEGYGKSTMIVKRLLQKGESVLFCCASWKQVHSKLKDFEDHNPSVAWSIRGLAAERGIPVVYAGTEDDFDVPDLAVDATIEAIMEHFKIDEDEANEILSNLRSEVVASRALHSDLVVTTFNTGSFLASEQIGTRIVVVDDPSTANLLTAKVTFGEDQKPFIKAAREAEDVMFGNSRTRTIWTTTEELVVCLIKKQHPGCHIKVIEENLCTDGRVLQLPSELVRKKLKDVLPGIHECVQEETKTEILLLGNGVQLDHNLVSTKGRNDLANDSVILISYPHPCESMSIAVSLGLEMHETQEIQKQMVVDVLDQAIGRSQGYRATGSHTLIVCDPNLDMTLRMRSRYQISTLDGLKRRGRLQGVPLVWAIYTPNWWSAWQAYLSAWQQYVVVLPNGQVFETLSLRKLEMSEAETTSLRRLLEGPAMFARETWKLVNQIVEDENGRKPYNLAMHELVNDFNKNPLKKDVKTRDPGQRIGQKWFEKDGVRRRYSPGSEPEGWVLSNRKKRT